MLIGRRRGVVLAVGLTVGLGVGLPLAGCTSSRWDTSEIAATTTTTTYARDEAGLTASLTDYLSVVGDDLNQWAAPADEASCAAGRLVRRLTVDHLLELGFDPAEPTLALAYPLEEKAAVVNILTGCIDFSASLVEMLSSYSKLPLVQSDCISEGVDRLGLDRDLAAGLVEGTEPDPFAGDARYGSGLASVVTECLDDEDLLPNAPMPRLPEAGPDAPRTTTSTTSTSTTSTPGRSTSTPGRSTGTTAAGATSTTAANGG